MRSDWIVLAAGIVLGVTMSSPARADDRALADASFREGRKAADAGDYATGYAKFVESQRYDPAVGTLLNIADCEEHLGRLAAALARYRGVLAKLPAGDDRTTFVKERVADLQKTAPRIVLTLAPDAPAGTRVRLDGEDATASLGTETVVDPGKHLVLIEAPGREPRQVNITVQKGELLSRPLEPGAALAPVEPPPPPPPSHPVPAERPLRPVAPAAPVEPAPAPSSTSAIATAGYVTGALGIVGLAVSAATGAMVLGKKDLVTLHCDATKACDQDGLDAVSSGKTLSTVSTAAFVVGAAALAGGVTLVILGRSSNSTTALHTTVSPWGGGVALTRAF